MAPAKNDQRQDRRVAAEMPVRYRVLGGTGELAAEQRTKTTNISMSGVAFVSPLNIAIDTRVTVAVNMPDKRGELECEAIVMRIVRELPGEQGVEYGIQFDMDTVRDQERLQQFVRSIDIVPLLEYMMKNNATDLHLTADSAPIFRVNRQLLKTDGRALSRDAVKALVLGTLSPDRRETFVRSREIYYPFFIPGLGRWRVSAFQQRGNIEAVFHNVDLYVPTIEDLDLPEILHNISLTQGGLVCVTGGAGTGKSTTIAAMIRTINREQQRVIVTIEDPIQYIHENERSVIKQREVGFDTSSVAEGLSHVLRQDPDVVVIDDVPDAEVMDMAMRAAETGRLVIVTMHTTDAMTTVRRIVGMYPEHRRLSVLQSVAAALRAVISQRIAPTIDGRGPIMIPEILTMTEPMRQAIRTNKIDQLYNLMAGAPGCITLDAGLRSALLRGRIDFDTASLFARDPEGLRRAVAV